MSRKEWARERLERLQAGPEVSFVDGSTPKPSRKEKAREWLRALGLGRDAGLDLDEPHPFDRLEALEEVVCGMGGLADQDAATRFEMGQILKRIEALEGRHPDRRESPVEASPLVRDLRDELDRERLKAARWKERAKHAEAGLQALKGSGSRAAGSDSLVNAKHLGGFRQNAENRLAASGHWSLSDEGVVKLSGSLGSAEHTVSIKLEHVMAAALLVASDDETSEA